MNALTPFYVHAFARFMQSNTHSWQLGEQISYLIMERRLMLPALFLLPYLKIQSMIIKLLRLEEMWMVAAKRKKIFMKSRFYVAKANANRNKIISTWKTEISNFSQNNLNIILKREGPTLYLMITFHPNPGAMWIPIVPSKQSVHMGRLN